MIGVMFPCLFGVMYSGLDPTYPSMSWPQKALSYFSFGRYAYPLYIVMDITQLPDGFENLPSIVKFSDYYGWPLTRWTVLYAGLGLLGMGIFFRLASFIVLLSTRGGKNFFQVVWESLCFTFLTCIGATRDEEGKVTIVAPGKGLRRRNFARRGSSQVHSFDKSPKISDGYTMYLSQTSAENFGYDYAEGGASSASGWSPKVGYDPAFGRTASLDPSQMSHRVPGHPHSIKPPQAASS